MTNITLPDCRGAFNLKGFIDKLKALVLTLFNCIYKWIDRVYYHAFPRQSIFLTDGFVVDPWALFVDIDNRRK
jgi:hypothetical protein